MNNLSKRYKYIRDGKRIWLKAVPDSGREATRFYTKTQEIANLLYNAGRVGGSLNQVCTAQFGAVIFQCGDAAVNLARAKTVTRIWREDQRLEF